MSVILCT
ncbi:unnamed protein product, partial [Diplocarpon coronariae]